METLYHQTSKVVLELQNHLQRLERASMVDENEIEAQIQTMLDEIANNCDRLDLMVNKEPPSRRTTAKIRVDQLKYDCQHLQAALRNVQHRRFQKEEEVRERDLLMSKNFTANEPDTSIMIDAALQQNQRLNTAGRNIDDMINTGSNILSNLREQGGTLKGVQRKVLDMMNTLGLSNTVLRLIERRSSQDKIILFGGMIVTCIIMFLVWKYIA